MRELARTLTGYYIGVLVVLTILNAIAWFVNAPRRYAIGVFSAGFLMGSAWDVHSGLPDLTIDSLARRRGLKLNAIIAPLAPLGLILICDRFL